MGKMKIPLLDTKGAMSDRVGRALMCNGQEGIEDILKARGWKPEAGPALVLMASVKEGKVQGMKLVTIGDDITITWEMEHLWQGFTKVKSILLNQVGNNSYLLSGHLLRGHAEGRPAGFPSQRSEPKECQRVDQRSRCEQILLQVRRKGKGEVFCHVKNFNSQGNLKMGLYRWP